MHSIWCTPVHIGAFDLVHSAHRCTLVHSIAARLIHECATESSVTVVREKSILSLKDNDSFKIISKIHDKIISYYLQDGDTILI